MRYFSAFTGIGGFELGIEQAYVATADRGERRAKQEAPSGDPKKNRKGLVPKERQDTGAKAGRTGEHNINRTDQREPHCVGYSEVDKYAIAVYQKHFPYHQNYGDITKINEHDIPDHDLFVGGFPCQPFSIAGRRGGFADTRGTLFHDIARIVKQKQPRLLLLENVKGLLSHDQGRTYATIIGALDELGYDCQWQVLNSKNHGVPQNRERVFIVGHLRGTARPEVFPLGESDEVTDGKLKVIRNSTYDTDRLYDPSGVARTLRANAGGKGAKTGLYQIKQRGRGKNAGNLHDVAPTITGKSYPENNPVVSKTIRSGGQQSPHGSKQNWDSYEINGTIRRLTPTECERLQGFPDGWTAEGVEYDPIRGTDEVRGAYIPMSDAQRYKMLGNAVTVNVIRDIMVKML